MVVEPTCDTGRVLQMVSSIVNGSEINRIHGKELDITMPHDGVANFAGKLLFPSACIVHDIQLFVTYLKKSALSFQENNVMGEDTCWIVCFLAVLHSKVVHLLALYQTTNF